MKRFTLFSIVFILCMGLSGCVFLNAWLIKGDIKDVKGAYQLASGEAGRGDVIVMRYLLMTNQKVNKDFIKSLPLLKASVSDDNKIKNASIGVDENSEVSK